MREKKLYLVTAEDGGLWTPEAGWTPEVVTSRVRAFDWEHAEERFYDSHAETCGEQLRVVRVERIKERP